MSTNQTLSAPVAGAKCFKLKAESMLSKTKAFEKALTADKLQEMSVEELELRVHRLDEIKTAFCQIHDRLERLDFSEIGSMVRDDFEELIILSKTRLNIELRKRKGSKHHSLLHPGSQPSSEVQPAPVAGDEKSSYSIGSKTILRDFYVNDLTIGGQSTQEVLEINDVRDQIPDLEKETLLKFDDGSDITKTLGLAWNPAADVLRFSLSSTQVSSKVCDESFPQGLNTSWRKLLSDMRRTHQMEILRRALDATADGEREVHLLFSKSRVAPWKTLTVSKFEFCTALLLAQLMRDVRNMKLFVSAEALSSISYEPLRFQVFVTNQVSFVKKLSSGINIPTDCNPTDIFSIEASPRELLESALWFRGPAFLLKNQRDWPESCLPVKTPPEFRKRILVGVSTKVDLPLKRNLVNSCQKMTHTFGFEYKFGHRKRRPGFAVKHVKMGTQMLIRCIQMSNLADDYWRLHSKQQISSSSPLSSLLPFIDSFGLMRVGGRLQNSSLDYNAQHPVILPRQHPVTRAIILDLHRRNLHSGPRARLAHMRLQFWPIGGRKTVSAAASKCVICFRAKPQLSQHIIADLPKDRVNATSTSMVTGLDFCGPFYYKTGVRNKVPVKTYICVFIFFRDESDPSGACPGSFDTNIFGSTEAVYSHQRQTCLNMVG
ncbi:uncharacterized protein LOC122320887 [Drosophila ficusphila]|uniref:uncharacterized protein LOC122320887 n=1 Tax=Drosophila ficusphila TaxID=30025 RepID=UPI001C89AD4D|nr:uncharacterized protein LOC122320887 [Drosophila ficusphila]